MRIIKYGIIGGGWRTEFFLRIAHALPEMFTIGGLLIRDAAKAAKIEKKWGIQTYQDLDSFLEAVVPEFVLVSVSKPAAPKITTQLVERGIPVLSETPPASDLQDLIELNKLVEKGAKIQVAEQYHLQPLHAARIALAQSGVLGHVSQVQLSICHDYHAVSLMRKLLGLQYENATITASKFVSSIVQGVDFHGQLPSEEHIIDSVQTMAVLDFGDQRGIYDFTSDQYFSWIRSLRLLVRGDRGEIVDERINYLQDFRTPVDLPLLRHNAGENGNLEGYYLKGITAGNEWIYRNPFLPGRLTDDEIAITSCLVKMSEYVNGGPSFYSLAEASQDHYISLMINRATETNEPVTTETQPWAGK